MAASSEQVQPRDDTTKMMAYAEYSTRPDSNIHNHLANCFSTQYQSTDSKKNKLGKILFWFLNIAKSLFFIPKL